MRNLADIFKALSDETRLMMLALLMRRGERCVCDFVQVIGIGQSKASRHLRYLLHSGLVRDRREGVWVYYQIREDAPQEAAAVLDAVRPVLEGLDLSDLERRLDDWMALKTESRDCQIAATRMET